MALILVDLSPSPLLLATEAKAGETAIEQALQTTAEAQQTEEQQTCEHSNDDTSDCATR